MSDQQPMVVQQRSGLNDAVQTGLLTLIVMGQVKQVELQREAARQREIDTYWSDMARYRTDRRDPAYIRSLAETMYEWDLNETEQQEIRASTNRDRPWRLSVGEGLLQMLVWGLGLVLGSVFIAIFAGAIFGSDVGNAIIWIGLFLGLFAIPIHTLNQMLVLQEPTFDPMQHSELCRHYPPGSTITTEAGDRLVSRGWPYYKPQALRARWPVTGPGIHGETVLLSDGWWIWGENIA